VVEKFLPQDATRSSCVYIAPHESHGPWINGDQTAYDPAKLDTWMKQQGDEGDKTENEAFEHQVNGRHNKESPVATNEPATQGPDRAARFE